MEIILPEFQIVTPNVNANKALTFKVRIPHTEYTQELMDSIYDAADNGTGMCGVLRAFQTEPKQEDVMSKKRQILGSLMEKYCESEGTKLEDEKERLYRRKNVKSRKELTEEQLDDEIERYRAGLHYNQ